MLKIVNFEKAVRKAKDLAESKLAKHESADEFVEIGNTDGFKIYVTAGKTLEDKSQVFHENPRDVFMLVLQGEIVLSLDNGEKVIVKPKIALSCPKTLGINALSKK
jgi:quercetin dioxygenase-like cupin family protein